MYSFSFPSAKGDDAFQIVRGVVGGFNKLCVDISLRVENMYDESKSSVCFIVNPKVDQSHESLILRNMEALGVSINNVAGYRSEVMLYLDIHTGGGK